MKTTMRNKLLSFVLTFMMILSLSSVAFADTKNIVTTSEYKGYFKTTFSLKKKGDIKKILFTPVEDGCYNLVVKEDKEFMKTRVNVYEYGQELDDGNCGFVQSRLYTTNQSNHEFSSIFMKKGHTYEIRVKCYGLGGDRTIEIERPKNISILAQKGRKITIKEGAYKFVAKSERVRFYAEFTNRNASYVNVYDANVEYPFYEVYYEKLRKGERCYLKNLTPGKTYYITFGRSEGDGSREYLELTGVGESW